MAEEPKKFEKMEWMATEKFPGCSKCPICGMYECGRPVFRSGNYGLTHDKYNPDEQDKTVQPNEDVGNSFKFYKRNYELLPVQ